jgi:short-subunit dehydrogenase
MNPTEARIVLTGAAGGIGGAVARQLAGAGAELVLSDVAAEPLDRLRKELAGKRPMHAVVADVSTEAGRAALVAAAREHRCNVLINAAGINPFGLVAEQSAAEISRAMAINATAPMLLCQALLPVLAERSRAQIINVGSTFGSIGFPGFSAYSASKFAVRGFSEALRRELADTAISVHYVAPRATRTALATDRVRAMNDELGVGMDSPEEVAGAIERVLRTERSELLLGRAERLFVKINALLPRLVDRSMRRQLPIVRRHAAAPAGRSDTERPPHVPAKLQGALSS